AVNDGGPSREVLQIAVPNRIARRVFDQLDVVERKQLRVLHCLGHNKRAVALERRDLAIDVQHLALQERGAVTRYDVLWHTVKYDLPSPGFSFSIGLRVFFESQRDCFVSSFGNLE